MLTHTLRTTTGICIAAALLATVSLSCRSGPEATTGPAPAVGPDGTLFPPINDPALPNARHVTAKVISGGAPAGDAGFRKLQELGVKTVVDVDGAAPDLVTAHRYGLRYVHLPISYSGVTEQQAEDIARALEQLPGPIYVHCHHGKHRSAAATAVACVYNGTLPPEDATDVLKTFSTGANYKGLWKAAADARPMDPSALEKVKVDYVEKAPLPPLADAMVGIDGNFEDIALIRKSGWQVPAEHPDLDAAHEALILREAFHEIGRTGLAASRPQEFKDFLAEAEAAGVALENTLRQQSVDHAAADAAFNRVGASCAACHSKYRD